MSSLKPPWIKADLSGIMAPGPGAALDVLEDYLKAIVDEAIECGMPKHLACHAVSGALSHLERPPKAEKIGSLLPFAPRTPTEKPIVVEDKIAEGKGNAKGPKNGNGAKHKAADIVALQRAAK